MKYKDYYAVLGVARDAATEDIKKAYRRLARRYHPDVSKEKDAEERFKEVSQAYEVLRDTERREAYDRMGAHRPGQDFRPPPGWESQFAPGGFAAGSPEDVDLFDLFSRLGRGQGGRRGQGMPGRDLEATVQVDLTDLVDGQELEIPLSYMERTAEGLHRISRTVKVRLPRGASHGQRLRVRGKGGTGSPPGDLLLGIEVRAHPLFRVADHDLYLELPLAPWEAALGAEVEVPTLRGRVNLRVPPGSRSGQQLRVRGRGLPRPQAAEGDLYAVLQIVTPGQLSEEEKRLYEQLAEVSRFDLRAHLR